MDVERRQRTRQADRRFPDRVVPEQAAVVGTEPDRPVRVFAQAADHKVFAPMDEF